jgi:hypothetical protein
MREVLYTALLRAHIRCALAGHRRTARALHRALALVHAPRGGR